LGIRYGEKQQVYPQIRYILCKLLKTKEEAVADGVAEGVSVALRLQEGHR
jgi:hypothetical protein